MTNFRDLTYAEQEKLFSAANTFYNQHVDHVYALLDDTVPSVPPSGSDMFRPELWKSCHWNWYFNGRNAS